jgi:tetratricopeptide (TPR) repeat protein
MIRRFFLELFTLGPAGVSDGQDILRLATQLGDEEPGDRGLLGAALYRVGQLEKAIRPLEEDIRRIGGEGPPKDWAFLAMAHQRLGHNEEARRWLGKLARLTPSNDPDRFWDDLEIEVLRREAEGLVLDGAFPADPFAR